MRRRRAAGSVTVLFSFILFLLISLVLVSVESARQQAAVSMLQTNLSTAMTSLQGQYYTPLFDEFDIYGLYKEDLEESLLGYLGGSIDPLSDLPEDYSGGTTSGYGFACRDISVTVKKNYSLTDSDGAFMRQQMISAGAVNGAEALIEELLEAIGLLKEQKTALYLLEEKAEAEEKLTAMDALLLQLIPYLDGIPTNVSGILCDENGKVNPERYFAKCLTTTEPTREAVRLDSFAMYLYLQPYYLNLTDLLQYEREDRMAFEQTPPGERNEEWPAARVKIIEYHIEKTIPKIRKAISVIREIRELREELIPLLEHYEDLLEEYGSLLSEDWMAALSDSISTMKQYVGETEGYYDFAAMQDRLSKNLSILENTHAGLESYRTTSTSDTWESALDEVEQGLSEYSFEGLEIRYLGMRRGVSVKDSFFRAVKNLIVEGLTSGVIDSSEVSAKQLKGFDLPSQYIGTTAFDVFDVSFPENASDVGGSTLWAMIRGWNLSKITDMLENALESLVEKALIVSYDKTHFSDFSEPDEEGALTYQLEYLLFGKLRDSENLRRAVICILGVRLLMNVIHTLTNPEKRERALAAATEIFGVVIPFLTKTCQYVILIAWALQNAKLETVEILQGKKVPFLVTGSSFQISFEEICSVDKKARFQKAEEYEDARGFAPKYGVYLTVFLMIHNERSLVFRSMDLMQEEIRMRHDSNFRLSDCLCGASFSVRAVLPGKYSAVPVSEDGGSGRVIEISGTCRY